MADRSIYEGGQRGNVERERLNDQRRASDLKNLESQAQKHRITPICYFVILICSAPARAADVGQEGAGGPFFALKPSTLRPGGEHTTERLFFSRNDVRFGSGTDILRTSIDVRLAPESGHRPELAFGCQKQTHAPQELAAHFAGTASFAENKTLVINRSEVHLVSDELRLRSPLRVRSGGSRLQTEFVAIS